MKSHPEQSLFIRIVLPAVLFFLLTATAGSCTSLSPDQMQQLSNGLLPTAQPSAANDAATAISTAAPTQEMVAAKPAMPKIVTAGLVTGTATTTEVAAVIVPLTVTVGMTTASPETPSIVKAVAITQTVALTAAAPVTAASGTVTRSEALTSTPGVTATASLTVGGALTGAVSMSGAASITGTLSTTETTELSPSMPTRQYVTITADRLNVRSSPSTEGQVVAKLTRGALIELIESDPASEWHRVRLADGEQTGWIAAAYAELVAAPVLTPPPASAVTQTVAVVTPTVTATPAPTSTTPVAITKPENMNVRGGPGLNYPIVANVPVGTALEILAVSPDGAWYQVRLEGTEEPGWVFAGLTSASGPLETLPRMQPEELPTPPAPESTAPGVVLAAAAPAPVSAPPPSGGGSFGYGVQAHMLGGGINEAVNATAALGFNWLKQQIEWRRFEGSPGALDFSELRRIVDTAGSRGINVLFSVVNAPDWAREPGFDANVGGPPQDPQIYANFVGRLAGEFCGSALRAIEVWNEQNLHYEWGNRPLDPADYMRLLRAAYGSIKSACPSMLVISGAPTPAGDAGPYARDDFAYLEGMYQNGLANYADGIGAHPSGYNVPPSVAWQDACAVIQQTGNFFNGPCDTPHHSWSFRSTMEGYRNIMNVYGDRNKRIWPTEFGWAVGPAVNGAYAYANDNTFDEQAAWTVEAFQMMRNWGWVGPAFLWNLNFRVVADGSEKAQWGIVRNDYGALPVYSALQAMAK